MDIDFGGDATVLDSIQYYSQRACLSLSSFRQGLSCDHLRVLTIHLPSPHLCLQWLSGGNFLPILAGPTQIYLPQITSFTLGSPKSRPWKEDLTTSSVFGKPSWEVPVGEWGTGRTGSQHRKSTQLIRKCGQPGLTSSGNLWKTV